MLSWFTYTGEMEMAMSEAGRRKKGGDRYRWAQMLLSPNVHKRLKHIALDKGVTLKELLEDIIKNYLRKEINHG